MGKFAPGCIASNGRELYAYANIKNYVRPQQQPGGLPFNAVPIYRQVLIKSNPDPVDLVSISWTLVSSINAETLPGSCKGEYCLCSVDDKGVFTLLGRGTIAMPSLNVPASFGIGFRYDPAFPPNENANLTGVGGWKNVTVPQLQWGTSYKERTILFPLKTSVGGQGLGFVNYAVQDSIVSRIKTWQLNFYTLDRTTLTFQKGPQWMSNATATDPLRYDLFALFYTENTLHTLTWNGQLANVTSFTFSEGTIPSTFPLQNKTLDITGAMMGCNFASSELASYTGVYGRNFAMNCNTGKGTQLLATANLDGNTTAASPAPIALEPKMGDMYDSSIFVPGAGSTKIPFLLVVDANAAYAINLAGPEAGKWQRSYHQVNITENDIGEPLVAPKAEAEDSGSGSSVGLIVGIVAGVAVIAGLVYFFVIRKRGAKNSASAATGGGAHLSHDKPLPVPTLEPVSPQGHKIAHEAPILLEHQSVPFHQGHSGQPPESSVFEQQHQQQQHQQQYQQHQQQQPIFQQQQQPQPQYQQQFRLSSHPQPSYVTTLNHEASNPTSQGEAPLPEFWEPQPFVPPVAANQVPTTNTTSPPNSSSTGRASYSPVTTTLPSNSSGSAPGSPPPPTIPSHSRPPGSGSLNYPPLETIVQSPHEVQPR